MTRFKKHEDPLDVQVVTKFFDQNGNELHGVIEYDPNTGYGKRFKIDADPKQGLVEEFFCGNGHVQIDGNTFDKDNYDEDEIGAIKTVIGMRINRHKNPHEYADLLERFANDNRRKSRDKDKGGPPSQAATVEQQQQQQQASGLHEIEKIRRDERKRAVPNP